MRSLHWGNHWGNQGAAPQEESVWGANGVLCQGH